MKHILTAKLFFLGFSLLVVRKILIACFSMLIVYQHWQDVAFEKMIEDNSFKTIVGNLNNSEPSLVLILNKHALNMTFNWLCNTESIEGVHRNSILVTLDEESSKLLAKYWPKIRQFKFIVPGLKDPFNYGDGYYQLFYLFRANLARALLHYNRNFWMIQQDTYWNDSILNINVSDFRHSDIIFDRASDKSPLIAGGYYYAKPTNNSRRFFHKLANDISWWYAPDNAYMTSMCEISGLARCAGLSFSLITNWQWLEGSEETQPKFIQFDGETKLGGKLEKMKKIGFYFLNDDKTTCNATSIQSTKSLLQSDSSNWNKVASYSHKQFKMYQNIVDTFFSTKIGSVVMNYFILPYAHYCMLSM